MDTRLEEVRTLAARPKRWIGRQGRVGACLVAGILSVATLVPTGASAAQRTAPARDAAAAEPLRILVPASLRDVASAVSAAWELRTGRRVLASVDATSRIVRQLGEGAPADLLLTADRGWMSWAVERNLVTEAEVRLLAGNVLVLIEPAASAPPGAPEVSRPEAVRRLSGRAGPLALAGEEVPAGRYARELLARLPGLEGGGGAGRVATGGSVRTALEWVARGEAPLGIVYLTDAVAEPAVRVVHRFDPSLHGPIEYLGAPVTGGDVEAARSWLALWAGEPGLEARAAAGFPGAAPGPAAATGLPQAAAPSLADALRLSILVALLAVVLGSVPAIAVGRLLARHEIPGRTLIGAVLLAPLVIPPVVTGFLLLALLGTGGPLGRALAALGITVPFTPLAAVLAATVVGLPLYAVVVRNAFQAVDRRFEELSWTLGVPPRRTFLRVALPLALPGIVAGAVLAFSRALGEFGATIVLAGNIEGETRTLALAVYSLLESPGRGSAIWTFVGASLVLSLAGIVLYERLMDRQRARMEEGRRG